MINIRFATIDDAKALLDIYGPYVECTAISFEYFIPTLEEFTERIKKISYEYPYIVAEEDGKIVGYAYASPFHGRDAYRNLAETSIYVDYNERYRGIGRMLYDKLEELLVEQNVYRAVACVAVPEGEDNFLTYDSKNFHEKMGYKIVGKHTNCGHKFKRWYSMVWMEKDLCEVPSCVLRFVKRSDLETEI